MEKCICSGLNDDCFFCGGLGFYQPMEKLTTYNFSKSSNTNSQAHSKVKSKLTPKEIILNHSEYSTQTLEKIRLILKEYIKNEKRSELAEKIEKLKKYIADLEKIIFIRIQQEPKRKYKKKAGDINKIIKKSKKKLKSPANSFQKSKKRTYEEKRYASKTKLVNKIILNENISSTEKNKNELMKLKFGDLKRRLT